MKPPSCIRDLRIRPLVLVHPLRRYCSERGVSLREAARAIGCSERLILGIVNEWRVPRRAEQWADGLGIQRSHIFPTAEEAQMLAGEQAHP